MLAVAKRDVLRGRAGELVLGALARDVDAAHARVAERVERVCVPEERGVVVVRVRVRAHPCAHRDARPVVERDVLHGVPRYRHCARH